METCSTLYYFNGVVYFPSIFARLVTIGFKRDAYTCEFSYGNLFTWVLYTINPAIYRQNLRLN